MLTQELSQSIVAVVGPTTTGKTALAVQLAHTALETGQWRGVSIISVDSRQVYKGLEVCTGADIPPQWKSTVHHHQNAYRHPELPIFLFGVSVIAPDQEWSVAHFRQFAWGVIASAFKNNELVICVGGTGLYHQHLFSTDTGITVGPDDQLRKKVMTMGLEELQLQAQQDAPQFWSLMNDVDRQNPRRLVRAIEKAQMYQLAQQQEASEPTVAALPFAVDTHFTLGITDRIDAITERIRARVIERLQLGAVTEVQELMGKYNSHQWKYPAFTSTGCKEVRMYIEGLIEYEELVMLWARRETQYAKRQLTWWRKHRYATSETASQSKLAEWYTLSEQDTDSWKTAAIQSCILAL